jgi:hypothetical protein
MKQIEIDALQKYLQSKLKSPSVSVKAGQGKDAPAEVSVDGEFLAVIYKNEDEGEISYDLNMAILAEDLLGC